MLLYQFYLCIWFWWKKQQFQRSKAEETGLWCQWVAVKMCICLQPGFSSLGKFLVCRTHPGAWGNRAVMWISGVNTQYQWVNPKLYHCQPAGEALSVLTLSKELLKTLLIKTSTGDLKMGRKLSRITIPSFLGEQKSWPWIQSVKSWNFLLISQFIKHHHCCWQIVKNPLVGQLRWDFSKQVALWWNL